MKQEVIDELEKVCASFDLKSVMSDFEYDKNALQNYEGEFAFVVYPYGTSLQKIAYNVSNKYIINNIVKCGFNFEYYLDKPKARFFYFSQEKGLESVGKEMIEYLSLKFSNDCYDAHKEMLDSMRAKQKLYIKCPDDRFMRAYNLSLQHNDKTFMNCINRLIQYCENTIDSYCELYSDFTDNSFTFSHIDYETGRLLMNGGVIYHGFPDEGYKQNGSVQIEPSYGWQINT